MKELIEKWRKEQIKWDNSVTMHAANDEGESAIRGIAFGEGSSAAYKDCADALEAILKSNEAETANNKK